MNKIIQNVQKVYVDMLNILDSLNGSVSSKSIQLQDFLEQKENSWILIRIKQVKKRNNRIAHRTTNKEKWYCTIIQKCEGIGS